MSTHKKNIPITAWHQDDRPREKMLRLGRQALSDSELLGIILGSGSRDKSAVDLAKEILVGCTNSLHHLGKLSIDQLMQYKGIGEAKAVNIAAALELGRRRRMADPVTKPKVTCSQDAYLIIKPILDDLPHEEFWIVILNKANRVIDKIKIGSGGVSSTAVDPRLVFKPAILLLASGIILAHNHPSGALNPSQSDLSITKKLKQAGSYFDIMVLDHIIIGDEDYYSFADNKML